MTGLAEIESFYDQYGENVLYRCRQLLRDEAAAWDAMHQTFVRAIKYRKSYRGDASPRSWLFTIATRVCLDQIKKTPPTVSAEPEDRVQESHEARVNEREVVRRLLNRFPRPTQEIVELRYFDDLEIKEIAHRTGTSERTVARRLQEFLQKARRYLEVPA